MRMIPKGSWAGTREDLRALIEQRIAAFKAACAAHAETVGTPAPREDDLIEQLARSGEPFDIEPDIEPKVPPAPTAEQLAEIERLSTLRADTLAAELLASLQDATPQQISTFVDNKVTDLPSARTMFKRVLLVLALLAKGI